MYYINPFLPLQKYIGILRQISLKQVSLALKIILMTRKEVLEIVRELHKKDELLAAALVPSGTLSRSLSIVGWVSGPSLYY